MIAPLVFAACALGAAQSQPPAPSPSKLGQNQQQTSRDVKQRADENQSTAKQSPIAIIKQQPAAPAQNVIQDNRTQKESDSPTNWLLNFFLVIVGALQVALIWRQNAIMRKQNAIMTWQHRPRLIVRNVVVESLAGDRPRERLEVDGLVGSFQIVNIGGTDARVTEVEKGLYVTHSLQMKRPFDDGVASPTTDFTIKAGGRTTVHMERRALTPAEREEIKILSVPIYFVALVRYDDTDGNRRETAACRLLISEHGIGRFKAVNDPDYEYSD